MDVQVQRPAKPLDHHDPTRAAALDALVARTVAEHPEHGVEQHARDLAAEIVIPRQEIPQPVRQAQDLLPDGHVGKHSVDEVGGAFRHPAPATAWAQRAPLAGEWDQTVEPAAVAVKPREPAGEPAAPQEIAKRLFHEPRQALPISQARCLRAERLEMIVNDPVQGAVRRRPRLVHAGE
jgi:hypothetical protein